MEPTRSFLIVFIWLLSSSFLTAQFTLSGEVRPRTEYRNGFKTPTEDNFDPAFFTEQRTRINMDFTDKDYTFRISLQDIRIWGEVSQIFKEEDGNTFLSEAWVNYKLSPLWSVKAGRQIISYDNQRFLGGLEWAQQGRRHDAVLFIFNNSEAKSRLDVGFAFNSDDDVPEPANIQSPNASFYSIGGNYKTLQYAWYHKDFSNANLSLLALNAGYQNADATTSQRQTFGIVARSTGDKLKFGGDFYLQTGKTGENSVSAYLAGVNMTYATSATPITLGLEYISGKDADDTSADIKHFRPDFGTNHAHNGLMDYFFVGPANGTVGVTDIYFKTKFKVKKSSVAVHGHHFLTGSKQFGADGSELAKSMGSELDFVYTLPAKPGVTFNIGYSFLLASDTMESLRGRSGDFNTWGWMMFTVKPQFFTYDKETK